MARNGVRIGPLAALLAAGAAFLLVAVPVSLLPIPFLHARLAETPVVPIWLAIPVYWALLPRFARRVEARRAHRG